MFGPALGSVVALLRLQAFNGLGPLRQERRFERQARVKQATSPNA